MFIYIDCFSGISGDMMLAGLIELGFPLQELHETIRQFGLDIEINSATTRVQGIQARWIKILDKAPFLRNLSDINSLIAKSELPVPVKEKTCLAFSLLAEAEAQVHGISINDVHFHEIGAVDTLVDIVGAFYGLHYLGIDELFCASIPWSDGPITMQHGLYPGPAPATAVLLKGMPCHGVKAGMELVTPTGAALLRALSPQFGTLPEFSPEKLAYGAGSNRRSDSVPNVLRLILGKKIPSTLEQQEIAVLQTQIDDMSPEHYSFLCETLLQNPGVIDVYTGQIIMKKARPGYLLTVLTRPEFAGQVSSAIILRSTSNGVRCSYQSRLVAEHCFETIDSPWGIITVKSVLLPDGSRRYKPEYEDCKTIALQQKLPIMHIYQYALEHCLKQPGVE
ncbi:MAG: nickel pincer cofactor biosynthesis protein LarC [Syntrophomonadaceae bacterium]